MECTVYVVVCRSEFAGLFKRYCGHLDRRNCNSPLVKEWKWKQRVFVAWKEKYWYIELIRHSAKLAIWIRLTTWAVIVKCIPSVTPRYLTDWEKWTVEFPTTRKSGRGVEFEILGVDIISAYVFSLFSLSLLPVIHNLTAWMHSCMDWTSSLTCCDGTDFCNWVSSAKGWWRTEWLSITPKKSVVYRTKRTHPRTDPCETPKLMGHWGRTTVV